MTTAGKLNPPPRAATYRTLIGLAAVTGMRVGEMLASTTAASAPVTTWS